MNLAAPHPGPQLVSRFAVLLCCTPCLEALVNGAELVDSDDGVGKDGTDFEQAAHGPDDAFKRAQVHVCAALVRIRFLITLWYTPPTKWRKTKSKRFERMKRAGAARSLRARPPRALETGGSVFFDVS